MGINDGGPAFPTQERTGNSFAGDDRRLHSETLARGGMSLRDWFAGQALASAWDARDKGCYDGDNYEMARCAYQIADAMLAARNFTPTKGD